MLTGEVLTERVECDALLFTVFSFSDWFDSSDTALCLLPALVGMTGIA